MPPDQVGELVLKGPSYCSGYWDNPEASAAAVDAEGWFHTGDVAYCDEDWYFFIVDRKKDMFISGGENVYPAEIEAVLYKHPAVHMCAVVGVPDPKWGEVGLACVVRKPGAVATEDELIAFLQERLARYKVPTSRRVPGCLADLCGRQDPEARAAGEIFSLSRKDACSSVTGWSAATSCPRTR